MKAFLIGRAPECDIVVTDPTVSRHHAELIPNSERDFLLVDCASTSGTYVQRSGEWRHVTTMRVAPDDRVKLGDHETSIGMLLAHLGQAAGRSGGSDAPTADRKGRQHPERNPETGEIMVPGRPPRS